MPDIQTIATLLSTPQQSGSEFLTAEEQRRILAFQQLQKMAGSTNMPIYSKGTGLLKVATGALGGFLEGKLERDAAAANAANVDLQKQYYSTFGGIEPNAAPPPLPPAPTPSVDMSDTPASPVQSASPMGDLPSMGPV